MVFGKVKRNILKAKQLNIFVSGLAYDKGKSGIADYTNNVVRELSKQHKLTVLIHPDDLDLFSVKNENISFKFAPVYVNRAINSMLWHLFILPFHLGHSTYDFIFLPAGNRRLLSIYPKPTIVTFHDLSQFHIENKYDSFRMFYIKKVIPFFLKKAQSVMAISKSTIKDMMSYYGMKYDDIILNYNGYNQNRFYAGQDATSVKEKYKLSKEYLLYIARIEHPGKNHVKLIEAYGMLSDEIKAKYDLVFAGSDWNGAEEVHKVARQSDCSSNIKFLGFVPDDDLPSLYCGATLYVFPSLYEGFGIPLVEAMASGTPVVCSNTSSLPEVGGEAVFTFNPESSEEIMESIFKVLTNDNLRAKMIERGLEEIKRFSWEKHTNKILEIYKIRNKRS